MFDSVWPHRRQPTRLRQPWILQARTLEWVAISFSNAWKWKEKVKSLSRVQLLETPWTAAYQAPPSKGIFQARIMEWVAIAFSTTIVWPQINNREGTQLHPSTKTGLKTYWAWPCPAEQDPVSPTISLSYQERFHKPPILIHQRTDIMKTTVIEKKNQTDHVDHRLV